MTGPRRPRPRTRPVKLPGGAERRMVQRCCNGCGRPLGDVTDREIRAAIQPDVRGECPACSPNPPGMSWLLELPITRPLSMNDRLHWRTKHRAKSALRRAVTQLARSERIPPLRALTAELHYVPRDRRTRDPLNLAETLKVCEDALVDANLVPDDNPVYVTSVIPIIEPPSGEPKGRLYLIVRELQSDDDPEGTHQL